MYAVFKVRYQAYSLNLTAKSYKPMGLSGLEPPTSRLSGVRSNQLSYKPKRPVTKFKLRLRLAFIKCHDMPRTKFSLRCTLVFIKYSGDGDEEIRTLDPLLARQVLSQLSYIPI